MMFSLHVLIRKSVFRTLFLQSKGLKVSYSFYFWKGWSLRDDLWDVQSDFWNITFRPINWEDVLITRINLKICISGSFLSIQESKSFVSFYFWQAWSLRDNLWVVLSDFWNITHRPIKWDNILITCNNSKICISGTSLSIKETKSFVFFLFLAEMIFKGWSMRCTVWFLKHYSLTHKVGWCSHYPY